MVLAKLRSFEVISTLGIAACLFILSIAQQQPRDHQQQFETLSPKPSYNSELRRETGAPDRTMLIGVAFQVYGKVQGVFFRKFTQETAKKLGVNGHCKNTPEGTVVGYLEGDKPKIEEMKHWLAHVGSPESKIEKVEFKDEKELDAPTVTDFLIIRKR